MTDAKTKPHPGWSLAVDYGPLLIFFLVYKFAGTGTGPIAQIETIIRATGVFMVATVIALIISKWRLGRVSPMLWLSTILIIGFGGLTIWLNDPKFIQLKPTMVYALLSALLFGGLLMGKPLLKYVLEAGYDGLSDHGWFVLSRNWAIFFAAMALLNEGLRATLDFDRWLTVKVWVLPILAFVFAFAHIPFMTKQGLGQEPPETPPAG
ncbi:MAG: inner membrane-spanning protein YciB [Sphingomonadaceae bacterium]